MQREELGGRGGDNRQCSGEGEEGEEEGEDEGVVGLGR